MLIARNLPILSKQIDTSENQKFWAPRRYVRAEFHLGNILQASCRQGLEGTHAHILHSRKSVPFWEVDYLYLLWYPFRLD